MSSTLSDTKTIVFQSTPSVWRETALACYYALWMLFQSTPSVWRETYIFFFIELKKSISIHSLRVEGDRSFHNFGFRSKKFQSTPSVWRETSGATRLRTGGKNFNPLPPCGGRRSSRRNPPIWIAISIHSLRVEGDERTGILTQLRRKFQSTPSVWRETPTARPPSYNDAISIHSLRVEGDFLTPSTPRLHRIFQSTPSVWRETFPHPHLDSL